jgi:ABC-type transport system involved in cytochrome c biogenesis permease subunit
MAVAIGILITFGERIVFAVALGRSIDLSEPGVFVMNTALVAIPFLLLAKRSSGRVVPWLLAIAATAWVHWWYLSMGIDYQRAPDGSGVPMFEALVVLLSPLPISLLALIADNILRRRSNAQ